jgi:hypothetical protein
MISRGCSRRYVIEFIDLTQNTLETANLFSGRLMQNLQMQMQTLQCITKKFCSEYYVNSQVSWKDWNHEDREDHKEKIF